MRVRDAGKRDIFRQNVEFLDGAIEQVEFQTQSGAPTPWQCLHQVVDHRAQAPRNLKVLGAVKANFPTSKLDEIIPVRRWENRPQAPGVVQDLLVTQVSLADIAKQTVKLIDSEHRGRWIIDRFGQRLDRNVYDDAEGESGILLDGALTPERDRSPQLAFVECALPPWS